MIWATCLEDLQNLENVEASLNGLFVSGDQVAFAAEFVFDALLFLLLDWLVEVVADDVVFIDPFLFVWASNFEQVDVHHVVLQVLNINFIQDDIMNFFCFFFIFYVDYGQKNVGARIKDLKLSFGFLVNAWIVTGFLKSHEEV